MILLGWLNTTTAENTGGMLSLAPAYPVTNAISSASERVGVIERSTDPWSRKDRQNCILTPSIRLINTQPAGGLLRDNYEVKRRTEGVMVIVTERGWEEDTRWEGKVWQNGLRWRISEGEGGENFDYSRCDIVIPCSGKGWKGHRCTERGETAGLARENNISPHFPVGDFPRERGSVVAGKGFACGWKCVSLLLVAASCFPFRG